MPITELPAVSLKEVEADIVAMEEKYFSTSVFLSNPEKADQVPEDEASEWRYLLIQRKALCSHTGHRMYPHMSLNREQRREYAPVDEQQAQLQVAA